ncbi:MAG: DUF2182 domain-containing protein [Nocardioidaceae bacterium]
MTLEQVVPRVRVARRPRVAYAVGAAAAAAWVVLARLSIGPHDMAGMTVDPRTSAWAAMWLLMVAAMMWPLATPMLDAVRRSAYPRWRGRLVLTCLATTTVLWLGFGVVAASVARLLEVPEATVAWQVAWLAVAIVLTRSARRARVLWLCLTLPPLAPGGRRGLVSAVRAGLASWRRCAVLCGPVMTAMVVGHGLVLLACASLAAWWEAAHPRRRHDPVPPLLLGAALAWLVVSRV